MSKKRFDLVVKTGTYTDANGNEKSRFKNVGVAMAGNDGGMFLLLDKTFNPAGIPGDDEACLISMYEPKQRDQGGHQQAPQQQAYASQPQGKPLPPVFGPQGGYQGDDPF